MRPARSTAVASSTTMPARLIANCIRCWRCQSLALPSLAEYWHMGATAIRLGISMGPMARGVNRRGTSLVLMSLEGEEAGKADRTEFGATLQPFARP